jgi:hypothetical protein
LKSVTQNCSAEQSFHVSAIIFALHLELAGKALQRQRIFKWAKTCEISFRHGANLGDHRSGVTEPHMDRLCRAALMRLGQVAPSIFT